MFTPVLGIVSGYHSRKDLPESRFFLARSCDMHENTLNRGNPDASKCDSFQDNPLPQHPRQDPSMETLSPVELLDLAKKQLGLQPYAVSRCYLIMWNFPY